MPLYYDTSIPGLAAPTVDHTANGGLLVPMVCGESVAFPQTVYIKSDGKMWLSDADAAASMPVVAIAMESGTADQTKNFLFPGGAFIRDDSWNWTVGGPIYADLTPGAMTQSLASHATGDQVQILGIATHADRMFLLPSLVLVEVP